MATFSYTTGKTALYLFPYDDALSLASWATYRILATEAASPNQGRYSFTPNALYDVYYLFDGASQPANWNVAVEIIDLAPYTINVLPLSATAPSRADGTTITVFQNEAPEVSINIDGATLDALDLRFAVEDLERTDILVIESLNITASGETFTVTIPNTITDEAATYRWSIRDVTGATNEVLAHGVLSVEYAANKDA